MSNKDNELLPGEDYAMIPRKLLTGLNDGRLNLLEFAVLMLLHIKANYIKGIIVTSHNALVSDLRLTGKNPKNRINKAMIELKKKGYLYFPNHRGCRGNITVELHQYRLTATTEWDISNLFKEGGGRSESKVVKYLGIKSEEDKQKRVKIQVKNRGAEQKLKFDQEDEIVSKVLELVDWAAKKRGAPFLDVDHQMKMVLKLRDKGFSRKHMKESYCKLLYSDFWQSSDRLPDFKTIWSDLKNDRKELWRVTKQKLQEEEQQKETKNKI